jgi:hypothetical protein
VALGSLGTVLAFIGLGTQTWLLWRQVRGERHARKRELAQRAAEYEREQTPLLSIVGINCGENDQVLFLEFGLHADGHGFAQNVGINAQVPDGIGFVTLGTIVLPFVRPPDEHRTVLRVPRNLAPDRPFLMQFNVFFTNVFNQTITFTQSARVTGNQLSVTDAPHYNWPWSSALVPGA